MAETPRDSTISFSLLNVVIKQAIYLLMECLPWSLIFRPKGCYEHSFAGLLSHVEPSAGGGRGTGGELEYRRRGNSRDTRKWRLYMSTYVVGNVSVSLLTNLAKSSLAYERMYGVLYVYTQKLLTRDS